MAAPCRGWPRHVAYGRVMLQMAASCRIWPRHVAMTASYRKWQRRVANGRALSPVAASCRQWPRRVANGCGMSRSFVAKESHTPHPLRHSSISTTRYYLYTHTYTEEVQNPSRDCLKSTNHRIISQLAVSFRKWLFVTSQVAVCHVANGYVSCSKLLIHPCQTTRTTP